MLLDVHSHFLAPAALEYIRENPEVFGTDFIRLGGRDFMRFSDGGLHPLSPGFTSIEQCLADMDARYVDKSVISVSPAMFYYDLEDRHALEIATRSNDYAGAMSAAHPDRIAAMATTPLQNMDMALAELDRVRRLYGMRAVEIACIVPGCMPDSEWMYPFYEYCQAQNMLIFIHPTFTGKEPPFDKYYNMNLIGYVQETNWALNRMILGGVFEKFPDLHVLCCHGGGQFPYQFGRMIHAWQVRPETRSACPRSPEHYLKNIYYDTVTHWTAPLKFLIESFGSHHVLLGTDYPYDMADPTPEDTLHALGLSAVDFEKISHLNYKDLTA